MKAHLGVDADSGLVHTVPTTPANTSDVSETHHLLYGAETEVFADAAHTGAPERDELKKCHAKWNIMARPSSLKQLKEGPLHELTRQLEHIKAQIHARVEHPFNIIKNLFRHKKVRY
ncbi:hypothetical protein GCM10007934_04520 [Mycoavidus cysteinexigens]|nr:putative transposase [bacterium endosymbiont of Mortierella elongata FMR23-6]GLR00641.1 hypothetical protein GCM10007934_04520 [Mycoavidus cysteinexigens]